MVQLHGKATMVPIVDHEMLAYDGKRKKALPKAKWRFLAAMRMGTRRKFVSGFPASGEKLIPWQLWTTVIKHTPS